MPVYDRATVHTRYQPSLQWLWAAEVPIIALSHTLQEPEMHLHKSKYWPCINICSLAQAYFWISHFQRGLRGRKVKGNDWLELQKKQADKWCGWGGWENEHTWVVIIHVFSQWKDRQIHVCVYFKLLCYHQILGSVEAIPRYKRWGNSNCPQILSSFSDVLVTLGRGWTWVVGEEDAKLIAFHNFPCPRREVSHRDTFSAGFCLVALTQLDVQ